MHHHTVLAYLLFLIKRNCFSFGWITCFNFACWFAFILIYFGVLLKVDNDKGNEKTNRGNKMCTHVKTLKEKIKKQPIQPHLQKNPQCYQFYHHHHQYFLWVCLHCSLLAQLFHFPPSLPQLSYFLLKLPLLFVSHFLPSLFATFLSPLPSLSVLYVLYKVNK